MRYRRISGRIGWIALALAVATTAAADEPQTWLERMDTTLTTRNYDGIYQHWQNSKVETVRIIHRVKDGEVMERLVSLDGSRREFIRKGSRLMCYLPDQRTVLVEHSPPKPLLSALPTLDAHSSKFYRMSGVQLTRLLGREAGLISIMPKDDYRYGYRIWIDKATAMPLKTQLCNAHGKVIEQLVFASFKLNPHIPDSAFKPGVSTAGFRWLRNEPGQVAAGAPPILWKALRLPPGFHMTVRAAQIMPGASAPVAHLVFSDGVASVSVFVESRPRGSQRALSGAARIGSSSTFTTVIDGHRVTAVGEVPPDTVRFIANSVIEKPAAGKPAVAEQPAADMQPAPALSRAPQR